MRRISWLSRRMMLLGVVGAQMLWVTGCGMGKAADPSGSLVPSAMQGHVHGGQQPVTGTHIYLFAASTTGYAHTATSLLGGTGYVTTDPSGNFTLKPLNPCQPGDLLYVVAKGGNPGLADGTNNDALELMAVLGPCTAGDSLVAINEATTVAAVYALAPFMTDAEDVGTSSTNISGLTTAFANALNLVDVETGVVLSTTGVGNGAVPQNEIDSLANVLSDCVNSDGTTSACTGLFNAATAADGSKPKDTLAAALNIANQPWNNVGDIFALETPGGPFQPNLPKQPGDWSLCVEHNVGLGSPSNLAIDAQGNVWVSNFGVNDLVEVDGNGKILSGGGYYGSGVAGPQGIAIDSVGNAWVASPVGNAVSQFAPLGEAMSGTNGYTGQGLLGDNAIAIDGPGYVWVTNRGGNSVSKLNSSGMAVANSPYTVAGMNKPYDVAIDSFENVWVLNDDGSVSELKSDGTLLHTYTGYGSHYGAIAIDSANNIWIANYYSNTVARIKNDGTFVAVYSGEGLNSPFSMSTDGGGNAWIGNSYSNVISRISSDGSQIASYTVPGPNMSNPGTVVADAAGSIWLANRDTSRLDQFIGAGVPTFTPSSSALAAGKLGTRP